MVAIRLNSRLLVAHPVFNLKRRNVGELGHIIRNKNKPPLCMADEIAMRLALALNVTKTSSGRRFNT